MGDVYLELKRISLHPCNYIVQKLFHVRYCYPHRQTNDVPSAWCDISPAVSLPHSKRQGSTIINSLLFNYQFPKLQLQPQSFQNSLNPSFQDSLICSVYLFIQQMFIESLTVRSPSRPQNGSATDETLRGCPGPNPGEQKNPYHIN